MKSMCFFAGQIRRKHQKVREYEHAKEVEHAEHTAKVKAVANKGLFFVFISI